MASEKSSETKAFWRSLPGILTGLAAVISAVASLGILDKAGVINVGPSEPKPTVSAEPPASPPPELRPTPSPEPTAVAPSPPSPDCSKATRPGYQSPARSAILDANRRHYGYSGKYVVKSITAIGNWAYVEGHPQSTKGPVRGYLMSYDGSQWNWRWGARRVQRPKVRGILPTLPTFKGPHEMC